MKRLVLLLALVAALSSFVAAQGTAPNPPQGAASDQAKAQNSALLPKTFAGWQKGEAQTSTDPAVADATSAVALREYGFSDFEAASYSRDDRKIAIKAIRFADATGAFGAFTFFREPQMLPETIGTAAAGHNTRIIFFRGPVLVQASYDRVTSMTGAELRELASLLPNVTGPTGNLPALPAYLPRQNFVIHSVRFALGASAYNALGATVPADTVRFDLGAEAVTGTYNTPFGTATLLIVSYPTPAIAGDRQRAIESAGQAGMYVKRSGPLVAVVTGQIGEDDARSLLASVNYDANITWNERPPTAKDNPVDLLLNEAILVGIVLGAALLAGLVFGAIRIMTKRYYPGRVFDRPEQMEMIELKIDSEPDEPATREEGLPLKR